ncbi:PhoH family protein, partial [Paenibacillus sepulcri]|nr:PhoH family protein [Paenibacillus sepulcri]
MPNETKIIKIPLASAAEGLALFGPQDKFLKLIEQQTEADIMSRDAEIMISGPLAEVESMEQLFTVLQQLFRGGYTPSERDIMYALDLAKTLQADQLLDLFKAELTSTFRGKPIRVKTIGQRHYVKMIKKMDVVFGIG